jgi:hypothetical protein
MKLSLVILSIIANSVLYSTASEWKGFNNPGMVDPSDPYNNDWHCDRHGFWHNDENDQYGHQDSRCHKW